MTDALATVSVPPSFDVKLGKIGFFPNAGAPRVLYLGVESHPALAALAERTGIGLERLGVTRETRPYTPHLTLARIRRPTPLERLHLRLEHIGDYVLGSFTVSGFTLFESQAAPGGSVYQPLARFRLPSGRIEDCRPI